MELIFTHINITQILNLTTSETIILIKKIEFYDFIYKW